MPSINAIFEELASTTSTKEKQAILQKHKDNEVLKRAIFLALSPMVRFYVKKIPNYLTEQIRWNASDLPKAMDALEQRFATRLVSGHAAIGELRNHLESMNEDDAAVLERIVKKDLRCGVQRSTANKVWKDLVPEYPVMLASAYDEKLVKKIPFPAYVQLKADGMRFNAIVKDGSVEYRSRNGKELDLHGVLDADFLAMANTLTPTGGVIFDGELLVKINGEVAPRQIGNGILSKAQKGTLSKAEAANIHGMVWDAIPYTDFIKGIYRLPYTDRLFGLNLAVQGRVSLIPSEVVYSLDDAQAIFEKYLEEGQEGIILKDMNMPWEDTRSKKQIKFKAENDCDLLCTDWVEGRKGTKTEGLLGALTCQTSDGKLIVNVGGGFTDHDRKTLKRKDVVGKIITVLYNGKIQDANGKWSLFLPRFVEIRHDKDKANSFEEVE